MAKNDDLSPATKGDLRYFTEGLMQLVDALYRANEQWKDEIKSDMRRWKDEIQDHFDIVAENISHDMRGINRDEIETIKDLVTKLEKVVLK